MLTTCCRQTSSPGRHRLFASCEVKVIAMHDTVVIWFSLSSVRKETHFLVVQLREAVSLSVAWWRHCMCPLTNYCVRKSKVFLCVDGLSKCPVTTKKKVKHSHCSPMGPLGFSGRWHRHLKVVSRTHQPFLPPEYSDTHFWRLSRPRAYGIVGYHGKNPQWHHRWSIPGLSD
jgi:hypothetical protein